MTQLYEADAVLLVGHDPTEQSPLVAWQIRSAIRHRGARLYIINSKSIKLLRKASAFAEVPDGREATAVRWLAGGEAQLDGGTIERLSSLKSALEKESNVVIVFGAELTGAAIRDLVKFGSSLPGQTRYMALGDYANSRGAADMGQLPDMLPGYVSVNDPNAREKFGALWESKLPAKPGMNARGMLAAAAKGELPRPLCGRREPGQDVRDFRSGPFGQARLADRAGSFPDGNRAARRHCPASRLRVREKRHHDQ